MVLDLYDGRVHVEGKRVLDVVELGLAADIFVNYVGPARNGAHDLVELHLVIPALETVEYHHLRELYLVVHKLAHVAVII